MLDYLHMSSSVVKCSFAVDERRARGYGFWPMEDRAYQGKAVRQVDWGLRSGKRMLLVAPTGAGKTCMGAMLAKKGSGAIVWVTHTKDLVEQSAQKLREFVPRVGIIAAGQQPDPFAPVQVASVQTLLAREIELRADLLLCDEAHHFCSDEWRGVVDAIHAKSSVGLTATPERGDGKPLGDMYDELVVAASYSELTAGGYLVPLRVLRPESELDRGLAQKVRAAYEAQGEGRSGFVFARTKKEAHSLAEEFTATGIPSAMVSDESEADERRECLAGLSREVARLRLLTNVYALTEGVDVPSASVAIYARRLGHAGLMLQTAGRILRPSLGKTDALLLDLPGVTHRLGLPNEDREYSLHGEGIRRTAKGMALKVCMYCGMTSESGGPCPRCGKAAEVKKAKPLRIYNAELRAVYAGSSTPSWAKRAELDRLRSQANAKGYQAAWVVKQYELLFGEKPALGREAGEAEKQAEFDRLVQAARAQGYQPGWAQHRYHAAYGAFPPKSWVLRAQEELGATT